MKPFLSTIVCISFVSGLLMSCSSPDGPAYMGEIRIVEASIDADSIEISWDDPPDETFSHVEIEWRRDGVLHGSVEVDGGFEACVLSGLETSTEYGIELRAVNRKGERSMKVSSFRLSTTSGTTTVTCRFVYSAADLYALRGGVDGYEEWTPDGIFVLMTDIDLGAAPYDSGEGWTPIGDGTSPFTGVFDGNGYGVKDLHSHRGSMAGYNGLFGYLSGAKVRDLELTSVSIAGGQHTGALAGYCVSSELSDCRASGTIDAMDNYAGGLVGHAVSSDIDSCSADVDVAGNFYWYGGLVGWNESTPLTDCAASGTVDTIGRSAGGLVGHNRFSVLTNCIATGAVTGGIYSAGGLVGYNDTSPIVDCHAQGAVTGEGGTGGLVGYNVSSSLYTSYATGATVGSGENTGGLVGLNERSGIHRCRAEGTVTGGLYQSGGLVGMNAYSEITRSYAIGVVSGSNYVGGFVGLNAGAILSNCYAEGTVSGGGSQIGGFIGSNEGSPLANCYAVGSVSGGVSNIGGLVGYNISASVSSCYYDEEAAGQSDTGKGEPRTTAQMKLAATYAGWDFSSVWSIDGSGGISGGYPYLRDNIPAN